MCHSLNRSIDYIDGNGLFHIDLDAACIPAPTRNCCNRWNGIASCCGFSTRRAQHRKCEVSFVVHYFVSDIQNQPCGLFWLRSYTKHEMCCVEKTFTFGRFICAALIHFVTSHTNSLLLCGPCHCHALPATDNPSGTIPKTRSATDCQMKTIPKRWSVQIVRRGFSQKFPNRGPCRQAKGNHSQRVGRVDHAGGLAWHKLIWDCARRPVSTTGLSQLKKK